ncbi:MAG TPA: SCO1664 family protein [Propionibacteriaceae bacterium]|nr:SCO1664 family protein [Propionibacteriaceae bacterium]
MLHPALTAPITDGELTVTGRLLQASNATFLAELTGPCGPIECVYKPVEGERPLWDFPQRTLGYREVAAYEVSRIGGFDCVPVTVFADGPLGPGSLQAWVDADEEATGQLVNLVPSAQVPAEGWFPCVQGLDADDQPVTVIHADTPDLKLLAVFDVLVNNADRKGGHILGSGGRVFGVDHGVTFHTDHKLRTLLWGWAGAALDERELTAVRRARDEAPDRLSELINDQEVAAFVRRADLLLSRKRLPRPRGEWPSIPWPPF